MTCSSASTLPAASRTATRKVASNTLALPLTRPPEAKAAPNAGRSTKIAGSSSVKSARPTGPSRTIPSPPNTVTVSPSIWKTTDLIGAELGQRVDHLGQAELHRGRAAARVVLGREVHRRHAVLEADAEELRAVGDGGRDLAIARLGLRRTGEEGGHRRLRDGRRLRHLAQDGHEPDDALLATEDEVGADDHRAGRCRGLGWASARSRGRGRPTARLTDRRARPTASALALGPGVRSGLVGSADAVGGAVGTDPRPPVAPPQAATSAMTATRARAVRIGRDVAMTRLLGSGSVPSEHPPRRSPSHRRAVTIRSQAAGAPCAGRPRPGWTR